MTGPSGAGPAVPAPAPPAAAAAPPPAPSPTSLHDHHGHDHDHHSDLLLPPAARPASPSRQYVADLQQQQNADLPLELLTLSDVPIDIVQLGPCLQDQDAPSGSSKNTTTTTTTFTTITAVTDTNNNHSDVNNNSNSGSGGGIGIGIDNNVNINPPLSTGSPSPSPSPSSIKPKNPHPRKPSPGLAARLKALGLAYSKQPPPTPQTPGFDRVGRLPEDQLRLLDQNHQANSTELVVERRGRPWKGAGAPLQLLRSKSSRDSFFHRNEEEKPTTPVQAEPPSKPELLPEIIAAPPLDMDTNKYRLPDHVNGNGTKAQLDTRAGHLERRAYPPEPEPESRSQTPPPPPPKDTPPGSVTTSEFAPDLPSYFNPLGLQRPGSVYTISRASFANQLAQLTALQLPDAELLSNKVAAIPTAQAAAKALIGAAEQIRSWISKASEVIGGLDSDDDVEWAAAGGREGYEEVEHAITRFESLINVYVGAIEALQSRPDIGSVSSEDLQRAVTQMEAIMSEWSKIRTTLNSVKGQVETAMEWEELWNMVLGDIQNEMDELSRLIFEMEERRHKSIMAVSNGDGVDIGDLETIVEETPPTVARNNQYGVPSFPLTPTSPGTPGLTQDDSSLLALFARMQPLRASLDFLPMRLSVFEARASASFPTACEELEMRRTGLEASYKKLEKDAESLRKELGEDKWVLVFRGAGRQAQKMIESVDRSMAKLREAMDQGLQLSSPAAMSKKIENYEAKKVHYGPAIERVLSIIDKGVKDRLTVNGEILRLHTELQSKWEEVRELMRKTAAALEDVQIEKQSQQLRDSISSMLSNDRSTLASGNETPGSSPPSSVVMSSLGLDKNTPVPQNKRRSTSGTGSHLPQPATTRRGSSGLAPPARRLLPAARLSTISVASSVTPPRSGSVTPSATRLPRSTSNGIDTRPRWNASTNTNDSDVGHNFKPLSLTTPSPYAKTTPAGGSRLPLRSPLARTSSSPIPEDTPPRKSASRLSFRERIHAAASPGQIQSTSKPRLMFSSSTSSFDNRRASLQPPRPDGSLPDFRQRPASSLSTTHRRISLLPQPKSGTGEDETGRHSPQAMAAARLAMRRGNSAAEPKTRDGKPRWHF